MFKTQPQHARYWETRQIDWKAAYLDSWNHPHREVIVDALATMRFDSLLELGCASGPNLFRISKAFPEVSLSGLDINPQAIETARAFLPPQTILQVGSIEQTHFADVGIDVVLTDMVLIYVADIDAVLSAIRRVARKYVIFCELHTESGWQRLGARLATGYQVHNYRTLLQRHGFTDIRVVKLPATCWPGGRSQKLLGYAIRAAC